MDSRPFIDTPVRRPCFAGLHEADLSILLDISFNNILLSLERSHRESTIYSLKY